MTPLYADDGSSFLPVIFLLALLVVLFMLMIVVIMLRSEQRSNAEPTKEPGLGPSAAPEPVPEPEPIALVTAPNAVESAPVQMTSGFPAILEEIRLGDDPLLPAMAIGLVLFLSILVIVSAEPGNPLLPLILLLSLVIIAGGTIGVRLARLTWRLIVLAAILVGAAIMLTSRFEWSPLYPGAWDTPDRHFHAGIFLIWSLILSTPVFLLPLFDPEVRRTGPAPSTWRVAAIAMITIVLLVGLDQAVSAAGLALLVLGALAAGILLFLGIISALAAPTAAVGAELGGIGALLVPLTYAAWSLLGGGWFS